MEIVISGVQPYDGRYLLDLEDELTTREWGWIKRLAGYLPLALEDAAAFGDPEFACALAAIALRRGGRVEAREVPEVFERLIDAPFGSAITIEGGAEDEIGEDDAGPPAESSNGSEDIFGTASRPKSATLPASPPDFGTPGLDTSEFERPTWAS